MKDIIQTRKDSLKKRHRHAKAETGSKSTSEAAPSDHEEGTSIEQTRESSDKEADNSVVSRCMDHLFFNTGCYGIIIISSIQPEGRLWQEPEPSQATGMALAHCILGSFLGVGSHFRL